MSVLQRAAEWRPLGFLFGVREDEPAKAPDGEKAGHGGNAAVSSYLGDVTARIGTYNPDKLSWTTKRKMLADPHIKACAALSALAVRTAEWDVDGPEPEVAEFVRAALEPVWAQIVRSCSYTGTNEGCAPHETVWDRRDITVVTTDPGTKAKTERVITGWPPVKIKDIDPASLQSIEVDGLEQFAGYKLTVPNITLPAEKCFHYAEGVRFGNLWGEGRLIAAYDPWYAHAVLQSLYIRFADRKTVPAVHVEFPSGEDANGASNADAAKSIAEGFQSDNTAVWTPAGDPTMPGWAINLIGDGQKNSATSDVFFKGMAMLQKRMMLAMLTPEKVLDGSEGSLALGRAHKDTWLLGVEGLLAQIIEAVNDQLVPRIVRYTFGESTPVPRVVPAGMDDDNRAFLGGLFTELVKTGGVSVDADSIAERIGVPTVTGESAAEGVQNSDRAEAVALAHDLQGARLALAAAMR